jgi:hypothetical protein
MLIDDNTGTFNMTEIKSCQSYTVDENRWVDEDRPSLGSTLLVVMGYHSSDGQPSSRRWLQYFIENAALGYRSLFCSIEVERPNRPAGPQLSEGCELATPAGMP